MIWYNDIAIMLYYSFIILLLLLIIMLLDMIQYIITLYHIMIYHIILYIISRPRREMGEVQASRGALEAPLLMQWSNNTINTYVYIDIHSCVWINTYNQQQVHNIQQIKHLGS